MKLLQHIYHTGAVAKTNIVLVQLSEARSVASLPYPDNFLSHEISATSLPIQDQHSRISFPKRSQPATFLRFLDTMELHHPPGIPHFELNREIMFRLAFPI
jgi:hypothetical protein